MMSREFGAKRKRPGHQYANNNAPEDGALILSGDAAQVDYTDTTPVWKQEVTDDQGRKRLHGAFTGGFSAGYFNSVGSKEGWTPSTFVSSRASRFKAPERRAIDLMDDEDFDEIEQDRQLQLQTQLKAKEEAEIEEANEQASSSIPAIKAAVEPKGTEATQLSLNTKKRPDYLPTPRGGAKALSLMDDDDEEDVFDIGSKIKYDKVLTKKKKKASSATAQHIFHARKVLRNPVPEPEVYRRRSPSPINTIPNVSEQRRLPSIGNQPEKSPAPIDTQFINSDRLAQISSAPGESVPPWLRISSKPIEEKIPPWRQQEKVRIPASIGSQTAHLALQSTFSPYPNNAEKHARYRAYLEHESGQSSIFGQGELDPDTFFAECEEFQKCALMYKPMTGAMSQKFTSSTLNDQEEQKAGGSESSRTISTQIQAAREGKYGHLTRIVEEWTPARLLCKRFDLQHPEVKAKNRQAEEQEMRGTGVNKMVLDRLMGSAS